jgi:hypothetical protein
MVDPEDIDPEVLAAAVEAYQSGLGGATPAADQSFTPAIMSDMEVIKAMGRDPMEMHRPEFAREAATYRGAVGKQQAAQAKAGAAYAKQQEKLNDPSFQAQQVYGRLGNVGAARVIAKSRGPALFQYGEVVDLGKSGAFYMAPSGYLMIPDGKGGMSKQSAEDVVKMAGVSVIPYLGGDEEANDFRNTTAKASSIIGFMDALENLYEKNNNLVPMSSDYYRAQQIEEQLTLAVTQLRSGSKSAAGISDIEMEAIKRTLPRRTDFRELDRDSRIKLSQTKQQLLALIMDRARRNGIDLRQIKQQGNVPTAQPQAGGTITSPISGLVHGR